MGSWDPNNNLPLHQHMAIRSNGYAPVPNGYGPEPNGYVPVPNGYLPKSNCYAPIPNCVSNGIPDEKPQKKKRSRTAFTTSQISALEAEYKINDFIDPSRRRDLAAALNLPDRTVKVWFQNKRMKEKKEKIAGCSSTTEEDNMQRYQEDIYNSNLPWPVLEILGQQYPTTTSAAQEMSYNYGIRVMGYSLNNTNMFPAAQPMPMRPQYANDTASASIESSATSAAAKFQVLPPEQSVMAVSCQYPQPHSASGSRQFQGLTLEPSNGDHVIDMPRYFNNMNTDPAEQHIDLPPAYVHLPAPLREPHLPAAAVSNPTQFYELPPSPQTQQGQENMELLDESQSLGLELLNIYSPFDSNDDFL